LADDSEGRNVDARRADTLYRAGEDEDGEGGTDTADETAELEDADREEVDGFGVYNGEQLTECEDEAGLGN